MSEAVVAPDSPPVVVTSRWATTAICSLVFVALCDAQLVAAIAPRIAANLGATETSVAGSVGVYAIAAASVVLLLSRFAGRARAILWLPLSAVIFVVAAMLAALSSHIYVFYLARALAGFAGGLISAFAITALADASAYAGRGKQMHRHRGQLLSRANHRHSHWCISNRTLWMAYDVRRRGGVDRASRRNRVATAVADSH